MFEDHALKTQKNKNKVWGLQFLLFHKQWVWLNETHKLLLACAANVYVQGKRDGLNCISKSVYNDEILSAKSHEIQSSFIAL